VLKKFGDRFFESKFKKFFHEWGFVPQSSWTRSYIRDESLHQECIAKFFEEREIVWFEPSFLKKTLIEKNFFQKRWIPKTPP
jgi:hypothetical protein